VRVGAAKKRAKPILRRGALLHEVAQVSLAGALAQIRDNTGAARAGHDPEATHQLRVGVRRLRVVLREFRTIAQLDAAGELVRELKWVFQRLGAVREFDVLLSEVVDPLGARRPTPSFAALHDFLARDRKKAARAAKAALASERFARLLVSLRRLGKQLEQVPEHSPPARKWARKRLEKRLRKVRALGSAALGRDPTARHELRKELKKLRYFAELVRGVWPAKRVDRFLKQLARVQDALGELTDADVHRELLARASSQLGRKAAADLQACVKLVERQSRRSERALVPLLADFEQQKRFWA
jgi:triphosphatase